MPKRLHCTIDAEDLDYVGVKSPHQELNCGKAVRMPVRLTDAPKRSPFNASYPPTVENVTPIKKDVLVVEGGQMEGGQMVKWIAVRP